MSKLEVKLTNNYKIIPHPKADKLELAEIGGEGGYVSVVGKGQFAEGEYMIYVPVDAVLPETMCQKLQQTSQITIGPRIRAARIRGLLSQGLCLKAKDWIDSTTEGLDVAERLGIKKYQPPEPEFKGFASKGVSHMYQNENFDKYTDIEHLAKYPSSLKASEQVVATVKYHGTNFRAGIVRKPFYKKSPFLRLLTKIGYFFGLTETQHEFLVGSHNTIRVVKKIFNKKDVDDLYIKIAQKFNIKQICENAINEDPTIDEIILYGEIIGPGIQKGYNYGQPVGEQIVLIFDVKVNGRYMTWDWVKEFCDRETLFTVQEVYRGPFNRDVPPLAKAIDLYGDNGEVKHVREGIVVKPLVERWDNSCGRVVLKIINPDYLTDTTNTDVK